MSIRHAKVSAIEDGANADLVRPSDWNADHVGLKTVRKTADETVNNSDVLQNDDELFFSVGANEVWMFFALLKVYVDADNDIKFAFTAPSDGAINVYSVGKMVSLGAPLQAWVAAGAAFYELTAADKTNASVFLYGIYVGGAAAGNVQLQWAQNTASALDTKVLANSCLVAFKVS
jgi:hypothetical protein